jgi:hypothetical protein
MLIINACMRNMLFFRISPRTVVPPVSWFEALAM